MVSTPSLFVPLFGTSVPPRRVGSYFPNVFLSGSFTYTFFLPAPMKLGISVSSFCFHPLLIFALLPLRLFLHTLHKALLRSFLLCSVVAVYLQLKRIDKIDPIPVCNCPFFYAPWSNLRVTFFPALLRLRLLHERKFLPPPFAGDFHSHPFRSPPWAFSW